MWLSEYNFIANVNSYAAKIRCLQSTKTCDKCNNPCSMSFIPITVSIRSSRLIGSSHLQIFRCWSCSVKQTLLLHLDSICIHFLIILINSHHNLFIPSTVSIAPENFLFLTETVICFLEQEFCWVVINKLIIICGRKSMQT